MALFAHLLIAFSFIILFYLAVTYSGIKYEINEIYEIKGQIERANPDRQAYLINQYNKAVERYMTHKRSVFAITLLIFCKGINKEFNPFNP